MRLIKDKPRQPADCVQVLLESNYEGILSTAAYNTIYVWKSADLSNLLQPLLRTDQGRLVGVTPVHHSQRRALYQTLREPAAADQGVDTLEHGLELEQARLQAGVLVEAVRGILLVNVQRVCTPSCSGKLWGLINSTPFLSLCGEEFSFRPIDFFHIVPYFRGMIVLMRVCACVLKSPLSWTGRAAYTCRYTYIHIYIYVCGRISRGQTEGVVNTGVCSFLFSPHPPRKVLALNFIAEKSADYFSRRLFRVELCSLTNYTLLH